MNDLCCNLNENGRRLPREWPSPYRKFETRKPHSMIFIDLSVHSRAVATMLSVKGCVSWAVSLVYSDQQRSLSWILRCHQPSVNSPSSWWRHGRRVGGFIQFSCSVVSNSLWPHGLQHARPPCPSPAPAVHPNPCPLSWWCHPTISSSVVPFSSCPQSSPALGSFQMSQFFASGGQSIGVSASASAGGWRQAFWEVDIGILFCPASPHRVIKSPLEVSLVYPHLDLLALTAASGMTVAMNLLQSVKGSLLLRINFI